MSYILQQIIKLQSQSPPGSILGTHVWYEYFQLNFLFFNNYFIYTYKQEFCIRQNEREARTTIVLAC